MTLTSVGNHTTVTGQPSTRNVIIVIRRRCQKITFSHSCQTSPSDDTQKPVASPSGYAAEMTRRHTRLKVAFFVSAISDWQSSRATFAVRQRVISPFGSRRCGGTRKSHEKKTRKYNIVRRRDILANLDYQSQSQQKAIVRKHRPHTMRQRTMVRFRELS